MSSNNFFTSHIGVKGASAFAISFAIDNLFFKNSDLKQNAMFASATTIGIIGGGLIGSKIPEFLPDSQGLYNGKLLSQRIIELTTGVTTSYCVNKFILNNDYDSTMWMEKLIAIGATDFAAEYAADYITGSALGYLTV